MLRLNNEILQEYLGIYLLIGFSFLIAFIGYLFYKVFGSLAFTFLLIPLALYIYYRHFNGLQFLRRMQGEEDKTELKKEFLKIETLIEDLNSLNIEIRADAALKLAKVDNTLPVPYLLKAYETEEDTLVRAIILYSLGSLKDIFAIEVILQALKDENHEIRKHACLSLASISPQTANKTLEELLKKENHPEVVEAIKDALTEVSSTKIEIEE